MSCEGWVWSDDDYDVQYGFASMKQIIEMMVGMGVGVGTFEQCLDGFIDQFSCAANDKVIFEVVDMVLSTAALTQITDSGTQEKTCGGLQPIGDCTQSKQYK